MSHLSHIRVLLYVTILHTLLNTSQYVLGQRAPIIPAPLTSAQKLEWLNNHNRVRCEVSPAASSMPALVWDAALEKTAQDYVNTCPNGHNGGRVTQFQTNSGITKIEIGVGENYAAGSSTPLATDGQWESEKPELGGHYTQMIWSGSTRLGCARNTVKCPQYNEGGYVYYYICNYYPAGNVGGRANYPSQSSPNPNTDACQQKSRTDFPVYTYGPGGVGTVVINPDGGGTLPTSSPTTGGGGQPTSQPTNGGGGRQPTPTPTSSQPTTGGGGRQPTSTPTPTSAPTTGGGGGQPTSSQPTNGGGGEKPTPTSSQPTTGGGGGQPTSSQPTSRPTSGGILTQPPPGRPLPTSPVGQGNPGATTTSATETKDQTGLIVGIIVGVIVGIALLALLVFYCYRRRNSLDFAFQKSHMEVNLSDANRYYKGQPNYEPTSPFTTNPVVSSSMTTHPMSSPSVQSHPSVNVNVHVNHNVTTANPGAAPLQHANWAHHTPHESMDNYMENPALKQQQLFQQQQQQQQQYMPQQAQVTPFPPQQASPFPPSIPQQPPQVSPFPPSIPPSIPQSRPNLARIHVAKPPQHVYTPPPPAGEPGVTPFPPSQPPSHPYATQY